LLCPIASSIVSLFFALLKLFYLLDFSYSDFFYSDFFYSDFYSDIRTSFYFLDNLGLLLARRSSKNGATLSGQLLLLA
jgi:hypothetical protein